MADHLDEYNFVNKSSLKFKGEKRSKTKKRKKKKCHDGDNPSSSLHNNQQNERSEDADDHGGWWKVEQFKHIRDDVVIELLPGCYAKALGNGRIILGDPHPPGDEPDEEEIFTAICAGTNQIALKSGFGRYLAIDAKKRLVGLSEAIGERELFLPVFEDGKTALCTHNDCFLSIDEQSDRRQIVACAQQVGPTEMLNIRVPNDPLPLDHSSNEQTKGDLGKVFDAELNYLMKGKQVPSDAINEERKRLKKARVEGQLHEALLDTRVKHKSDKYCK